MAVGLLLVLAMTLRHVLAANTDVSWLLIAAEKLLDGQRLYLDIIETNPPIAVLVYVPAIWLARASGLPAEAVVDALVFAAIAASLALSAATVVCAQMLDGRMRRLALLGGVAVLAILPMQTFGQREHIAVIAMLPAIVLLAARAGGDRAPAWVAVIAGIGLGLALSFKPYFAVAWGLGILAVWLRARSWRVVVTLENAAAAVVLALYAAIVLVAFPDYFVIIGPLVRDVYLPIGPPLLDVITQPVVPLWAVTIAAAIAVRRRGAIDPAIGVLIAVSTGFAVAYVLQGKGWPYHSYPMMACALLALGYAIAADGARLAGSRVAMTGALALLAGLFLQSLVWFDRAFDARILQPHVARLGPNPVILAITGEPGIGHPLTRALGGTWVSRQQAIWVAHYADYLRRTGAPDPATLAMLERYAARERDWLAQDIRRTPPSVVLVDNMTGKWGEWLVAHREIADLLKDYRKVDSVNGVDILTRPASR